MFECLLEESHLLKYRARISDNDAKNICYNWTCSDLSSKFQMMMLNMFSLIFKVSDDDAAAVQSNNTQGKKGIVLSTHSNKVVLIGQIVTWAQYIAVQQKLSI